jgi:hypothetical protein
MLHVGLDLSRRRLDVCLLDEGGEVVAETAVPADADGLRGLAQRLAGRRVRAVIESMNGARFVHDTLEEHGWEVDSITPRTAGAHTAARAARPRSPSPSGGEVHSSTISPAGETRQTSTLRRLKSNPACNMKTGLLGLASR